MDLGPHSGEVRCEFSSIVEEAFMFSAAEFDFRAIHSCTSQLCRRARTTNYPRSRGFHGMQISNF